MNIDSISKNKINDLLNVILNTKSVEHYSLVAEQGLKYEAINEVEYSENLKQILDVYSPFSTFASKVLVDNNIPPVLENIDKTAVVKSHFISKLFNNIKNVVSLKEFEPNVAERKYEESINKCISDELIKSNKILNNKDLSFPALIILMKAINNIENPQNKGVPKKIVQEVGILQLGLALESMQVSSPELYKYNKTEGRYLKTFVKDNLDTKFLKKAVEIYKNHSKNISLLSLMPDKNPTFDNFIGSINDNILTIKKQRLTIS